jgi:hypothetical protein
VTPKKQPSPESLRISWATLFLPPSFLLVLRGFLPPSFLLVLKDFMSNLVSCWSSGDFCHLLPYLSLRIAGSLRISATLFVAGP